MDRIAAIVITAGKRKAQVRERILPDILCQQFDDVIVVGEHENGDGFKYLHVTGLTNTTVDALVKRDVGTLATDAPVLLYLCDDHTISPYFVATLRTVLAEQWDVIVPNRCTMRDGATVALNNGEREGYCAGHAGVFRRDVVVAQPWSAHTHHRNWDKLISHYHIGAGVRYVWSPRTELTIIDLEPFAQPWL